ncbi:hypothetical protein [Treponema phagedenis]|uniref:Uncharacterized protein n=1 Tax=Treponema phagedenis TaxID=162 RepID=A0AAE6IW98_TREPH|nr:hypothetical protein [Treponema phagedenis]EFW37711.1 hypothetical protein HMPREF9554_01784 [Treponema phagedenis F0421]NVP24066.1 hypothetical protein [Treponema phagedenis]QEJ96210.1 hypothetical protein FUT79_14045 [Treponema phagedenis]QEJ99366.1 hypothetical protein FUT82_16155 [Treponema phagedenis]QEJ99985.1 hypothetical protein FUT84_01505 [Treponema phagedenis]
MTVLLVFCLPLIFFASISVYGDKGPKILAFLLGILLATVMLFIRSFFIENFDPYAASLLSQWGRFFFLYFFFPCLICLPIYLGIHHSFDSETLITSSSCLFGVYTAVFFSYLYNNTDLPVLTPLVLMILSFAASLYVFEAILRLVLESFGLVIIEYLIAVIIFLVFCGLGALVLCFWFFMYSPYIYGGLMLGLCLVALLLYFITN